MTAEATLPRVKPGDEELPGGSKSSQGNTIIAKPRTQKVWCRQCNEFHSTMDVQATGTEEEGDNTVLKFRCWNNNNDGQVNLKGLLVDEHEENAYDELPLPIENGPIDGVISGDDVPRATPQE